MTKVYRVNPAMAVLDVSPDWQKSPVELEELFDSLVTVFETQNRVFAPMVGLLIGRVIRERVKHYHGTHDDFAELVDGFSSDVQRFLDVLGLFVEVAKPSSYYSSYDIRIVPRDLSEAIHADRLRIHSVLEERFPAQYESLKGAYQRHLEGGPDAYRQSLDSCRNLLENLLKSLAGTPNWKPKLDDVAKSSTLGRLVPHVYEFLSGTGTHSPKNRTREDSLLGIRVTEAVVSHLLLEDEAADLDVH